MTEVGSPCPLCAVRPDVACRHRPADPSWSMGPPPARDADDARRAPKPGAGFNFHRRRGRRKKGS